MAWWGWIVLGAVLLGAEIVVPTDFYLVGIGVAALLMGVGALVGLSGPVWAQWLVFAGLSAGLLVGFRRRVWSLIAAKQGRVQQGVIGDIAVADETIAEGTTGRAILRGTVWTVKNEDDAPLQAGTRLRVICVEGLVLHVERES